MEALFQAIQEGETSPAIFKAFVDQYERLGDVAFRRGTTLSLQAGEEALEALAAVGPQNFEELLTEFYANVDAISESSSARERQRLEQRNVDINNLLAQALGDADDVRNRLNTIFDLAGRDVINYEGIWISSGRNRAAATERVTDEILANYNLPPEVAEAAAQRIVGAFEISASASETGRKSQLEYNLEMARTRMEVDFTEAAIIRFSDTIFDAEVQNYEHAASLGTVGSAYLEAALDAEAYATSVASTAAAEADARRREIEERDAERERQAAAREAERLLREAERQRLAEIRAQQDAYRELGRVGRQAYETIADAIEDEREVSRRAFEDRRFELEQGVRP